MDIKTLINERLELGNKFLASLSLNESFESSTLNSIVYKNRYNMRVLKQCDAIEWSKVKDEDITTITDPAEIRQIFNGAKTTDDKHPLYIYTDKDGKIIFINSESSLSMNKSEFRNSSNPMRMTGRLRYAFPGIFDSGLYDERVKMRSDIKNTFIEDYGVMLSNLFRGENDESCTLKARIYKLAYLIIQNIANHIPSYHAYSGNAPFYEFEKDSLNLVNDKIIRTDSYENAFNDIKNLIGYKGYDETPYSLFYFETTTLSKRKVAARYGYENFMNTCINGPKEVRNDEGEVVKTVGFPISKSNVDANIYSIFNPRLLAAVFAAGFIGHDDSDIKPAMNVYKKFLAKDDKKKLISSYKDADVSELISIVKENRDIDTRWSMLTNLAGASNNEDYFTQVSLTLFPEFVSRCYVIGANGVQNNRISKDDLSAAHKINATDVASKLGDVASKSYRKYYGNKHLEGSGAEITSDIDTLIRHFSMDSENFTLADMRCIKDIVGYVTSKTRAFNALRNDGTPYVSDSAREALIDFCQQPDPEYDNIHMEDMKSIYDTKWDFSSELQAIEVSTGRKRKGFDDKAWTDLQKKVAANIDFIAKKDEVIYNRYKSFVKRMKGSSKVVDSTIGKVVNDYEKTRKKGTELDSLIILLDGFYAYVSNNIAEINDKVECKFIIDMCSTMGSFKSKCPSAAVFISLRDKMDSNVKLLISPEDMEKVKSSFVELLKLFKGYDFSNMEKVEGKDTFDFEVAKSSRESIMRNRADKKLDRTKGLYLDPEHIIEDAKSKLDDVKDTISYGLSEDVDHILQAHEVFKDRFKGFCKDLIDDITDDNTRITYTEPGPNGKTVTQPKGDFEVGDILCYDPTGDGKRSKIYVCYEMDQSRVDKLLQEYTEKYKDGRYKTEKDPNDPKRLVRVKDEKYDFEKGYAKEKDRYAKLVNRKMFINASSESENKAVSKDNTDPKYNRGYYSSDEAYQNYVNAKVYNRLIGRSNEILNGHISTEDIQRVMNETISVMQEYMTSINTVIRRWFDFGYPTNDQIVKAFSKPSEAKERLKDMGFGNAYCFVTDGFTKDRHNVFSILNSIIGDFDTLLGLISTVYDSVDEFENNFVKCGDLESNREGTNPVRLYIVGMSEFMRNSKMFDSARYKKDVDALVKALEMLSTMELTSVKAGVNKNANPDADWTSSTDSQGRFHQGVRPFSRIPELKFDDFMRISSASGASGSNWEENLAGNLENNTEVADNMSDGLDIVKRWLNGEGGFADEHKRIEAYWSTPDVSRYNGTIMDLMNQYVSAIEEAISKNSIRKACIWYENLIESIDEYRNISLGLKTFGGKPEKLSAFNELIHNLYVRIQNYAMNK